jgi:prepilin-type N-terminal cleavage/methylation domain-containing protein
MNKKPQHPPPSDRGFTLLELLISMTLLVVILVITLGALRISSRSVAAGEKKMESQERFRTVLSILDAQIQSQVPLTYEEEGQKKYYFRGNRKTLRFSSNHSIWGGQKGYVVVDYRVESDQTGKEVLHASEQIPGIEGRQDTWLIKATEISFEYFHKDPTEEQGKWTDQLSDGNIIPEKIRFQMVNETGNLSLVCPVRVRGKILTVSGGASR